MKYIKKPVKVEAYQITISLLEDVIFSNVPYPLGLSGISSTMRDRDILEWKGKVTTIHGQETVVTIGDYIISEPDGIHFYPCKSDIFKRTYWTEREYAELNI